MAKSDYVPQRRLLELIDEITDGDCSAERQGELTRLLRDDDRALAFYWRWMRLHSLLHLDLTQTDGDVFALRPLERPAAPPGLDRNAALRLAVFSALPGVLAACLLLAIVGRGDLNAGDPYGLVGAERAIALSQFRAPLEQVVAVLSEMSSPVWGGGKAPAVGAALPAGRLDLDAGIVQLEFVSGAIVVVEGPAELDLVSSMQLVCQKGRLRAHVPTHAQGFVIDTPTQRAVDLGTEFAVNVAEHDVTEIHVLDGEVEVLPLPRPTDVPGATRTRLTVGMGLRAEGRQKPTAITANGSAFVSAKELMELAHQGSTSRHATWRAASERLQSDPRVLLYYSFEGHQPWDRVLRNDGPVPKGQLDGAIVGGRWVEGRWPWKQALEFKRTSDRVRVDVPGWFDSATFACWVRIDGFDRSFNGLFLTEGHDHGEVHWQVTETGQLLLCVKADPTVAQEYLSPSALSLSDVGRWVHLACVYDDRLRTVAHYRDGSLVSEHPIAVPAPLSIGRAELGNWQPSEWVHTFRVRSLNGRMDEFVLLDEPLADDEIAQLYRDGRP